MVKSSKKNIFDYNKHVSKFKDNSFLEQVYRTQNGKPISEQQFKILLKDLFLTVNFQKEDNILDLCCGNGHLSSHFFNRINQYYGIDISSKLINIAKKNFLTNSNIKYDCEDILNFLKNPKTLNIYNKILCIGAFHHFSQAYAIEVLSLLFELHKCNKKSVYIMLIPDLHKAREKKQFLNNEPNFFSDLSSPYGMFWDKNKLVRMCEDKGWKVRVGYPDKKYYSSDYRFNLILT